MSGRAASPVPAPIRRRFTSGDLATRETLVEVTEGPVDLCVEIRRDGLDCALGDQGREAPLGYPPDPPLPEVDPPFELPEGGFGWHIIRCLTTDLRYRREGAWNVLSFRMPFSGLD
jgi:serine/threonine-protein kinase RsbW